MTASRPSSGLRSRRAWLGSAALALGLAFAPRAVGRAQELPAGHVRARLGIVDLANSTLVLTIAGRERRARFTPLTRVTLRGLPGAVTDLRPGMDLVVQFAASEGGREGTLLVAIDAH